MIVFGGVDLVRKVGGRGMVGAGASWRSVESLYIGGATILRMGYKTMLRAERAEFFWVSTPNCKSKNCGIYLF